MPENDKKKWKQTSGFAEDTEVAQVVCKEEDLKKWDEEAPSTRSKYLYTLIQEARAYRKHGLVSPDTDHVRIQELQDKVERLEARLEEQRSGSKEAVSFEPSTLKDKILTDNYQSLEEILKTIIESGLLDDLLRQPVENQLYFLAAQDEVMFERGWGWKLAGSDGGVA